MIVEEPKLFWKSFEDHKKHFTERLLERYGIELGDGEYETICLKGRFQGVIKRKSHVTLGFIELHGKKVWVLYLANLMCYSTCYPPDIETDLFSAIRATFAPSLRRLAFSMLMQYLDEVKGLPTFEDVKSAAIWYFENTVFPPLHIEKYKFGSVTPMRIMLNINRIINNEIPYVKITAVRIKT